MSTLPKVELTKEGYKNLQDELTELKSVRRTHAVDALQKARAMGDLSENSAYTAAREELSLVEGRIAEIETILKYAVVTNNNHNNSVVTLGSTVTVEINGNQEKYTIVGEYEADPMNHKLSQSSPIGSTLLKKRVNDIVTVKTPDGNTSYKIVSIN